MENPDIRKKFNKAIRAGKRKDYEEAARILEELLSTFDTPPEAYLFLGRARHGLKEYSRALASFNDFIRLRPRSPEGYRFAGRTYLALGMPQRGVPFLKKALELEPGNVLTMALLGTAYLKSRRSQSAVDMLQQAVESALDNTLSRGETARIYRAYLNSLLVRGIQLCRREDYELGMQMLGFVLENGIDIPLLRLELGRACREMGALDKAVEHYSQALNYVPHDIRLRWYRASLLMELGRNGEALEDLELIRSTGGDLNGNMPQNLPWNSELVDFFMIRSFLEVGEWRRAAESARNWLKRHGGDEYREKEPLIRAMFAEAQRNLKNFSAAENHLRRALELTPSRIELWYAMLLVSWEGEDWKTLRKAINTVKNLKGDRNLIRRFSILLDSKTGEDDQQVLGLLQSAVRSLGPEPELMFALGERCLKMGLIEASIVWFKKTILMQKHHERAYLAEIAAWEALMKEGVSKATQELKAAYKAYLDRWPDNHAIRREMALFLVHLNEFTEAATELEWLLAWEPANPTLRRILAYVYRKTGRFREAAVFLKGLLKEKPKNAGLLLEYAGCLARAGTPKYAIAVLEKAMTFLPKSSEIPIALGLLLYREGRIEKTFDLLREAAERNPRDPKPYQTLASISRKIGDVEGINRYEYEARRRSGGKVKLK